MSTLTNLAGLTLLNPVAGIAKAYNEVQQTNKFGDASGGVVAVIIIFVLIAIILWIMSLVATYRLTGSGLEVVLCFIFGSMYLFFAWIYYGFTGHKLVKISKA